MVALMSPHRGGGISSRGGYGVLVMLLGGSTGKATATLHVRGGWRWSEGHVRILVVVGARDTLVIGCCASVIVIGGVSPAVLRRIGLAPAPAAAPW